MVNLTAARKRLQLTLTALSIIFLTAAAGAASQDAVEMPVEKQVFHLTEVQRALRPHGTLIITSDEEMEELEKDPTMRVRAFNGSLEDQITRIQGADGACVNVAYDFFFGGTERNYFPTSDQCIRTFKALHDMARKNGVGFGASVLSPLDLGPAYYRARNRGGQTRQFQEGRIQHDGSYSVPVRVQRQWFHNKGPVQLVLSGVRAFAFSERRIGDTSYYAVNPDQILDISHTAHLDVDEDTAQTTSVGYGYVDGVVSGQADGIGERDRVLVVLVYDVEEMDYFHQDALPFLKDLLDSHKTAGITYDSFYSDEMHIQFDWDLQTHFGLTEIDTRYATPAFIRQFASQFGEQYADFDKYLVYFAFAQHDSDGEPEMSQHVFGPKPGDIYATWKFRRDYFRTLQDGVVDLFIQARRYGEEIFGRDRIWTRAHATWQESPTCDHVDSPWKPPAAPISRYDYTPAYEWSSSIRESISACCDYFRWGDFLTAMGNDFPEGGFIDRNYYGAALTCSFGAFNDVPYSYWGHWGAPRPVARLVHNAAAAFGVAGGMWNCGYVQGWQHRRTPVLALYPMDLNYIEERYGSWMVQYGYCDYLTEEKFAELVDVLPDGRFRIKDREYSTLVILFEPMVFRSTLHTIRQVTQRGGSVLWTGPPPAIYHEDGADALSDWCRLFGIDSVRASWDGLSAEDAVVAFRYSLNGVPPFRIPTHLLVDRIYPAVPGRGTEAAGVVTVGGESCTVATYMKTRKGGQLVYFGGRPRDDQSGSTPDAPRTLYHLLRAMKSYREDGPGWAEIASNTGDLLVCESPNGAVSVTHHYHQVQENWSGEFFRDKDEQFDESVLPPTRLSLANVKLGPHVVSYEGDSVLTFRVVNGVLAAFSGLATTGITIDGRDYRITDSPTNITFAPIPDNQLADGIKQAWIISAARPGGGDIVLRLPFPIPQNAVLVPDPKGNGRGIPEAADIEKCNGEVLLRISSHKQRAPFYIFVDG